MGVGVGVTDKHDPSICALFKFIIGFVSSIQMDCVYDSVDAVTEPSHVVPEIYFVVPTGPLCMYVVQLIIKLLWLVLYWMLGLYHIVV